MPKLWLKFVKHYRKSKRSWQKSLGIAKRYFFWKFIIEFFLYSTIFFLILTTIRVAIYIPFLLKESSQNFVIVENFGYIPWVFTDIKESSNLSLFLSTSGVFYPPFTIALFVFILIGFIIMIFFRTEERLKSIWAKAIVFNFTLFGILITLFSIWGS